MLSKREILTNLKGKKIEYQILDYGICIGPSLHLNYSKIIEVWEDIIEVETFNMNGESIESVYLPLDKVHSIKKM